VTVVRARFHGELEQLSVDLAVMCGLAATAMECATQALLRCDLVLAERVISDDEHLDERRARCAEQACRLLALHAPVARDLRFVVTGIQIAEKIERMGDLARHVAEIAPPPPPLRRSFGTDRRDRGDGSARRGAARAVQQIIAAPTAAHYAEQERADDRIDALQREVLAAVARATGADAVRAGIDVALLARFFERFSDQTVSVTRRVDYIITGTVPGRTS